MSNMERVTDDEIIVDKMLLASNGEKENPALPSYGRSLVPYFCPNTSADPTEDDINIATDLDAYRRGGASILDIPAPGVSKECVKTDSNRSSSDEAHRSAAEVATGHSLSKSAPLKLRKRGAGAKNKHKVNPQEEVSSPTSPLDESPVLTASSDSEATDSDSQKRAGTTLSKQGPTWQQEELQKSPFKAKKRPAKPQRMVGGSSVSGHPKETVKYGQQQKQQQPASRGSSFPMFVLPHPAQRSDRSPESRAPMPERFAGAAFHNSPAPSCLPLPTFACQKVPDSSTSARLNLFSSPPRSARTPATPHDGLLTPPRNPGVRAPLLHAPSTPEQLLSSVGGNKGLQMSAEQATLKLQELLKLGTPSPLPLPRVEESESFIATTNLRRMLQLA